MSMKKMKSIQSDEVYTHTLLYVEKTMHMLYLCANLYTAIYTKLYTNLYTISNNTGLCAHLSKNSFLKHLWSLIWHKGPSTMFSKESGHVNVQKDMPCP